jgi:5-methyltetrahydrofolate--homocysteine methyltransferase
MSDAILAKLGQAIFSGDDAAAVALTEDALQHDAHPFSIIEEGLIPGMQKVGDAFHAGEIFLPEMLISAEAMKACLALLKPLLTQDESRGIGTVVIGTVLGDVHDIGKNLVSWMLEGAGFRVVDMGVDVPPETFIQAVQSEKPHIVALSSLLTTSAHQIGGVIESLKRNALREQVKVLIGGASVNQAFADRIGADGYALDAATAVSKAKELLGTAK